MEHGRIRLATRRGMLELDLILGRFFDQDYATLSPVLQDAFVDLLQLPDMSLFSWLVKHEQPDDEHVPIVTCILARQCVEQ